MPMHADAFKDLLASLDESTAAPEVVAEFRRIVETVGARHGLVAPLQGQRIEFARTLLDGRRPRAEIRDRLMHRFSIGESQAYRDIASALQIVPKPC